MAVELEIDGRRIRVDGAAEESTLREIAKILTDQKSGKTEQARRTEENFRRLADSTDTTATSLDQLRKEAQESQTSQGRMRAARERLHTAYEKDINRSLDRFADNTVAITRNLDSNINTANSGLSEFGRNLIDVSLTLAGDLARAGTGVLAVLPKIGPALSKLGSGAVSAAEGGLKFLNNTLAVEYQKRIDSLDAMTTMGASFAQGLDTLTLQAEDSRLGIVSFTNVVKNSSAEIRSMGMSATEGAQLLSNQLANLATDSSDLRRQMFALGYQYEEQGELVAEYLARERISRNIRMMDDREIAAGTRDYARNLKILSDLTGEDARQLMEKSRAESLRASLQDNLNADQNKAFTEAFAQLSKFGPEVQNALVQQLTLGTVRTPAVAASAELTDMIRGLAADINAGRDNMVSETATAMSNARERIAESSLALAADIASIAGVSGIASEIAEIQNRVLGYMLDAETIQTAQQTADKQLEAASSGMTKSAEATSAALHNLQNTIESMANDQLANYAAIVGMYTNTIDEYMVKFSKVMDAVVNNGDVEQTLRDVGVIGEKRSGSWTSQFVKRGLDVEEGSAGALASDILFMTPYSLAKAVDQAIEERWPDSNTIESAPTSNAGSSSMIAMAKNEQPIVEESSANTDSREQTALLKQVNDNLRQLQSEYAAQSRAIQRMTNVIR